MNQKNKVIVCGKLIIKKTSKLLVFNFYISWLCFFSKQKAVYICFIIRSEFVFLFHSLLKAKAVLIKYYYFLKYDFARKFATIVLFKSKTFRLVPETAKNRAKEITRQKEIKGVDFGLLNAKAKEFTHPQTTEYITKITNFYKATLRMRVGTKQFALWQNVFVWCQKQRKDDRKNRSVF